MGEPAEQLEDEGYQQNWSMSNPTVRKAVAFIRRKGGTIAVDDLLAWDASHGRKLFNWNDAAAAMEWRLQQARMFLNTFRSVIDGMRVRAFINVPANEETGTDVRQYVAIGTISNDPRQRAWVINNVTRRAAMLMSELKFLKLTKAERNTIIAKLSEAMGF